MAYTLVLESGTTGTKVVDGLLWWANALDRELSLEWTRERANKKPNSGLGDKDSPSYEGLIAGFDRRLALLAQLRVHLMVVCLGLAFASMKESPGRTDDHLQGSLKVLPMLPELRNEIEMIAATAEYNSEKRWNELTECVQAVRQALQAAIQAGEKPLPPAPRKGFFGNLGRILLRKRITAAWEHSLVALRRQVGILDSFKAELDSEIAKMG